MSEEMVFLFSFEWKLYYIRCDCDLDSECRKIVTNNLTFEEAMVTIKTLYEIATNISKIYDLCSSDLCSSYLTLVQSCLLSFRNLIRHLLQKDPWSLDTFFNYST